MNYFKQILNDVFDQSDLEYMKNNEPSANVIIQAKNILTLLQIYANNKNDFVKGILNNLINYFNNELQPAKIARYSTARHLIKFKNKFILFTNGDLWNKKRDN